MTPRGRRSITLRELARKALGSNDAVPAIPVRGIAQDHRKVRPGFIFVARRGEKFDGHRYARLAIERGAVAVVGSRELGPLLPWRQTPYLNVPDDRIALAKLAAEFFGHPSRDMQVVGVTGTDGKTTVSYLLHHLLSERHCCSLLSTAAVLSGSDPLPLEGHFTTPEAPQVQEYLASFREAGSTHVVLESSSHALDLKRLDEVDYDLAVWTNLSAEHLDFHGSMEGYREAKLKLIKRAGRAVLNRDDDEYEHFAAAAGEVVDYGYHRSARWRAETVQELPGSLTFTVVHDDERLPAQLPMLGSFNVHNALAALAAAAQLGLEPGYLVDRLASFPGVPGRMQVIHDQGFTVVVDFAHTGPALEKALAALRPVVRGRLLLVLGAAGERDPGKRRPLGRAAAKGADLLLFTEEDHRSEDLGTILDELEAGAREGGASDDRIHRVPDRRTAIEQAIAMAEEGDLVLLAGKGHESTLERSDETLPWDEAAEARKHLS